jgi:hypothetical protein
MGKQVPGLRHILLYGVVAAVLKFSCLAQGTVQDGRIHLDVVVSDAAGKPVPGLDRRISRSSTMVSGGLSKHLPRSMG